MIPYKWPVARAVPQSMEVRLEIAKAIRAFLEDDDEQFQARRAEIVSIKRELNAIAQEFAKLRRDALSSSGAGLRGQRPLISPGLRKYGYNPDEPRIPKHNRGGGEWTRDTQFASSTVDDATSILRRRGGHHFVPKAVYKDLPLKPETKKVFDDARTGSLNAGQHGWSKEHVAYNQAVAAALKQFLADNGIEPEEMTPEQALQFVFEVIGSSDPRIRDLNLTLYRREILQYILHHIPFIGFPEGRGGSGGDE
jgi:hypothetical protein